MLMLDFSQPLLDALLLPDFLKRIGEFFNLTEMKRTWQSADDPPLPNRSAATSGWDLFGSFHSTTGNIIGDAGIPMELNADKQRSVSFYYKDGD
ncbi:hypothetical protein niasHS_006534 [Heterodera schachtii]|uniref:Uncharacterized protein n=1 Tax=Heterodera schachtii TaxID=97005 RepID=A0ABD2JHT5_HETSC